MKRIPIEPKGDPLVIVMQLEELTGKIDMVIEILKRIEGRQIKTTEAVMEVKEHEAPIMGSFASSDSGGLSER